MTAKLQKPAHVTRRYWEAASTALKQLLSEIYPPCKYCGSATSPNGCSKCEVVWRPVGYPELTVRLEPSGHYCWLVLLNDKPLGSVLQVLTTVRRGKRFIVIEPWHWRYLNSNQNRGSHLTSVKDACSGLLFALLSEGKLPKGSSHA